MDKGVYKSDGKTLAISIEINEEVEQLMDLKAEIKATIEKVEMRYLNGKNWEEIALALGYDRSTVFRIHGKAIKEIKKIKNATECD